MSPINVKKLLATVLRLAHKFQTIKDPVWHQPILGLFLWPSLVLGLLLFTACSPSDRQQVDKLNAKSYAYHYRDLDSTVYYAKAALQLAETSRGYADGAAEANNHLAFVSLVKVDYLAAERYLNAISQQTDNQIELLVSYVQQMRLCQRRSRNKDFHDYRERAITCMKRIDEERDRLSERQHRRLLYAETEFAIVNSTYYYYVGLERKSVEALRMIDPNEVQRDTAQYLNYLYNIGAGGILTEGTQEEINQREFDHLLHCFLLARQGGYSYFVANALEALSEHLIDAGVRRQLMTDNMPAMKFINPDNVPDDQLPVWLAGHALDIFEAYGDVYQISGAYRTLASCYLGNSDYRLALENLENALADSTILQAPDLVASIREQLSVAYAAMNDKKMSDYNRNIYIDLQEQTRQDRYLEARAAQYDQTVEQLNWMLLAVVLAIILLACMLLLFYHLHRRGASRNQLDQLLTPLRDWQEEQQRQTALWQERYDEVQERFALNQLRTRQNERRNLEQRAKVSLVNSVTPLIDRIIHEVKLLDRQSPSSALYAERIGYIRELTDQINAYNDVLTHWIQLRQGEVSLHIESFAVQSLFDIVAKGRMGFVLKGLTLEVEPTKAVVKADRILTLFMLNTLADNARKFTPSGGQVKITASDGDDYVEIAVQDSGAGMPKEQLEHLFDHQVILDHSTASKGHGFGLVNCRGIIEKYRKMSQIFRVCSIYAESEEGKGSRFAFRLPKGFLRMLLWGLFCLSAWSTVEAKPYLSLERANIYADSAYFSNINGTYERTLMFADSCRHYLNEYYRQLHPDGRVLMLRQGDVSLIAPEIHWYHDSLPTNYQIILDIRNESAIAALALHQWQLYGYNNRIYTQLYKEMSADNRLSDYCRTMQTSQTNKTIAVILLVLVLLAIMPAYYWLYYRHRLYYRFCVERIKSINRILLSELSPKEKLTRIEPLLTDRYPDSLQHIVSEILQALSESELSHQQQIDSIEMAEDECRRSELEDNKLHVSNSVLDNCLSALKHETMYYPSRIRQLVDVGDTDSLSEVVVYYRELYGILSLQAQRQVEGVHLHLRPLAHGVLGDENLMDYLFEILRREDADCSEPSVVTSDDKYVELVVRMPSLRLSESECANLFTPSVAHVNYLLCRQIVRDHGEAASRRGCGIEARLTDNGEVNIHLILPKAKERYGQV